MKRCVIIGAAPIKDYVSRRSYLKEDDFFIYCDGGLRHREGLGFAPDLIVGDFDSYEEGRFEDFGDIPVIRLPVMKDETDSYVAAMEGLKRGFDTFVLVGLDGGRFDHSLANVGILYMLCKKGADALMVCEYEDMTVVGEKVCEVTDDYRYFSVMPVMGDVKGLTIKDAKYEVSKASLTLDYPYAISNETLPGKKAAISISDGYALLVKDRIL